MSVVFQISTGSQVPIYRQITDQVRLGIVSGRLKEGDPLPSVRALAEELAVNPNTVAKAYAELIRDSVVESRMGKGVFVAAKRRIYTPEEQIRRLEPSLQAFLSEAMSLGFEAPEVIALVKEGLAGWKKAAARSESTSKPQSSRDRHE